MPVLRGGGEGSEDKQADLKVPIFNSSNESPEDADSDFLEFNARSQPPQSNARENEAAGSQDHDLNFRFNLAILLWLHLQEGVPNSQTPPTPPVDRLSPSRSLENDISDDDSAELLTQGEANWMLRNVHAMWPESCAPHGLPAPNQWLQTLIDQGDHDTIPWIPPRCDIRATEYRRGSTEDHLAPLTTHDIFGPTVSDPPTLTTARSVSSHSSNDKAKGHSSDDHSGPSEAHSLHLSAPPHSPDNA